MRDHFHGSFPDFKGPVLYSHLFKITFFILKLKCRQVSVPFICSPDTAYSGKIRVLLFHRYG